MRTTRSGFIACATFIGIAALSACSREPGTASHANLETEVKAIQTVLDKYVASVDSADPELARQVWADREDISFIHPRGHEEGWAQVKDFYVKLMGGMFSERKLTIKKVSIKPLGNSALVTFYWDFQAKWRKDGSALTTQGRETDILLKDSHGVWKLFHVHYSGMPTTKPGQGF